jgi:Ser/Thr protein kinase RdoA (MazF antagonist)
MNSPHWEALTQWGADAVRIKKFTDGVANDVWRVQVDGKPAVGRLGARSDDDLAWEAELVQHLHDHGLAVPTFIPTTDGRLFVDGLSVMTYVEGEPPHTENDWRRVADTLRKVHELTRVWPQRPGWRSSTDLLHHDAGTKVDLGSMPPEAVARCRTAWARLADQPTSVVHGDTNGGNIRITADRVGLIDWDESHVDVSQLDLVLPFNAAGLGKVELDTASQASAAWEAAVCWDDDYAKNRLAEVRPI